MVEAFAIFQGHYESTLYPPLFMQQEYNLVTYLLARRASSENLMRSLEQKAICLETKTARTVPHYVSKLKSFEAAMQTVRQNHLCSHHFRHLTSLLDRHAN